MVSPEGGHEDESTCWAGTMGMTFLSGLSSSVGAVTDVECDSLLFLVVLSAMLDQCSNL